MASLNRIEVIGNVGQNPEMRFTPAGKPVTSFSIATSNKYEKDGEWKEETTWFNIVCWNKLAETCNQFVVKGQQVYAEGRLHLREWDGNDGQKHFKLEIIANSVLFLGKKGEVKPEDKPTDEFPEPEDIPF